MPLTPPVVAPPLPIPEAPLVRPTQPPPTTALPETVPLVSQPLRPVLPETLTETQKKLEEEGIYFNVADEDIREVVKQISRALGKNFLLDDKLKGKITIISERKMTKDEIWEAFQSALDVLGYTIVQGPAGLLRIVAVRDALSNPIDLYSDASPFTDRFITRLITLKNISASDMANVIKGLVSKEGNLFAYPVTNTLILTDSGTNIDRLLKLINELDREGPQEVLEIIPILYANAKDVATKVTQIFETERAGGATPTPRKGKEAAVELEEAPRLRKVISDDRTNTIIVLASKMAIKKVRDLIKKLDSPLVGDEGEVHVYYLKHANAKDMATLLGALAGQVAKEKEKDKKGGTTAAGAAAAKPPEPTVAALVGGAEFSGKFNATADEATNALVITASSKDFNTLVDQVIAKLDIPRRQVYVEALIVELVSDMQRDLGTGVFGGKTINIDGNELALFGNTFGFLNNPLTTPSLGAAHTGDPISITPGPGATSIDVPKLFAAFQAQQSNVETNVLSTPNILTMDNEEAEINVGEKVPFPSSTQPTGTGLAPFTTFTRENITLSLKIKPQISESDTIKLTVEQKDDNVKQGTEASAGGPTTTTRTLKTSIVAQNGQTVVLGGLMKDFNSTAVRKIPLLGDIPVLGYLFKTKARTKKKANLVVFLTPNIIREPRDFLAILQKKINQQNAFIEKNFGKAEQRQIRQTLATHAEHLLKFGAACDQENPQPICDRSGYQSAPYSRPASEEDQFPMDLGPTPFDEGGSSSRMAPPPPPPSSGDEDLAVQPKLQKKGKKKETTPPPEPPPASSSPPPSSSDDDIDLAY